jgi:hypothetical protein
MRFLDSWLHGASAGYRVGEVYRDISGPNRTIGCILDWSARLYGDGMEPDHTAKYSLPMLTDLTENLIRKNQLFMC